MLNLQHCNIKIIPFEITKLTKLEMLFVSSSFESKNIYDLQNIKKLGLFFKHLI